MHHRIGLGYQVADQFTVFYIAIPEAETPVVFNLVGDVFDVAGIR